MPPAARPLFLPSRCQRRAPAVGDQFLPRPRPQPPLLLRVRRSSRPPWLRPRLELAPSQAVPITLPIAWIPEANVGRDGDAAFPIQVAMLVSSLELVGFRFNHVKMSFHLTAAYAAALNASDTGGHTRITRQHGMILRQFVGHLTAIHVPGQWPRRKTHFA